MRHGFVKVAAVTPKIKVADTSYNGELIRKRELSLSERMFGANILDWYKTFAFKY